MSIQNHLLRKKFQTTSSDNRWRSEESQLSNPKEFLLHQWETSIHFPLPSLLGERNLTAQADVLPKGNHVVSYCTGRPTPVGRKSYPLALAGRNPKGSRKCRNHFTYTLNDA
ncbi:hypothetical protein NPIL_259541 [Nephila pilipes]|uniref:Uncharacterized protein n=1 Tax=Nephila pilipes TaxID=299642 RepID=A0A8X6TY09_NEPPI|nr:hypothetical protein NPIL_259541 [Nephila pilipes]